MTDAIKYCWSCGHAWEHHDVEAMTEHAVPCTDCRDGLCPDPPS